MTHQSAMETFRQLTADLSPDARHMFNKIGKSAGYTLEQLAGQPDTVDVLKRASRAAAGLLGRDVEDAVAERLFDVAHEHCGDEGCTGGGMLWCQDVARLLVDPHGPLAEIASELHRIHDEAAEALAPPATRELVVQRWSDWLATGTRVAAVRLVAAVAALVEATDRAEAERLRRMTARNDRCNGCQCCPNHACDPGEPLGPGVCGDGCLCRDEPNG